MSKEIKRLASMTIAPKKLYLSGPMSASYLPDYNYPAFHAAAARLRSVGYEVANPAEVNPDTKMSWRDFLRLDIAELVRCDAVAVLPNWLDSKGARLETYLARELEMPVETVETFFAVGRAKLSGAGVSGDTK